MVMPIVLGVLGTVSKGMEERLGEDGDQKKNQDHSNYSRIGKNTKQSPCCLSDTSERPSANAGVKNLQRVK